MLKSLKLAVLLSVLICLSQSTSINVVSPPELVNLFKNHIQGHLSPIGYQPLRGKLQGLVVLADPIGACDKLSGLQSYNQEIFVLADDSQCLQSIKAKNIANSGGYVGLIKQNINNTLHDKEINLVHIPIVQIKPADYDILQQFAKNNKDKKIALSVHFADSTQKLPIKLEFWFSPTQKESYVFLLQNKDFILSQSQFASFAPHYVLQSQRETKNYIGCLSSGRYCPTQIQYQGKYEGKNIVEQTLRQIIIWDSSPQAWWKYITYFYKNCLLNNQVLFLNKTKLSSCSQSSAIIAGIDQVWLKREQKNSFLGSSKQVDDNTYLLEERQHYVKQQISSHPTVLINKKMVQVDSAELKKKICKMEGEKPSSQCASKKKGLSSKNILIVLLVILAVFVVIAFLYKLYIHLRMKKEIKSQVESTLEQYYRYMETFEGQDGQIGSLKKSNKKEQFKILNEQMEEVPQSIVESSKSQPQREVQMQIVKS